MLYKLTIPRIYIFGEQSLPDNDSEILPTYGIRVATVRNAGHGMIIDNPEGFASVITDVSVEGNLSHFHRGGG